MSVVRLISVGRGTLTSRWALLRENADATPEQAAVLRALQFRAVMHQTPLTTAAMTSVVAAANWLYWDLVDHQIMGWLTALLVLIYFLNFYLSMHWMRQPADAPVTPLTCWLFAANVAVASSLAVGLFTYLFGLGTDLHRLLLMSVAAAMATMGGWLFSSLLHAGLTWSLFMCGGGALGLLLTQSSHFAPLAALMVFYGLVLCASVVVAYRMNLQSIKNALALEKQNQVVGLLLNDFEEHASDWLWEVDRRGLLKHAPSRMAQVMGMPLEQIKGQPLLDLLAGMAPSPEPSLPDPLEMHVRLKQAMAASQPFRDVVVPIAVAGRTRWWSLSAKPLISQRRGLVGWRGVGADITDLHERDEELLRLASVDFLTGLSNRHCFNQALEARFVPGSEQPCTLLLLDLDNFKQVNDLMGHAAGDQLLCEVARRAQGQLPPGGVLARLGGDEFAVLLDGHLARAQAQALADRLQASLNAPCFIDDHLLDISASLGVAFAPMDARSATDLMKSADLALYSAKAAGRRVLNFYEPHMGFVVRHRFELLADLKLALKRQEFELHYQPQFDLASGRLVGMEALVRWRHPVRGMVPPMQFIPLAEDSGLIVELGKWVLMQACEDAAQWPDDVRVAVNISAVEFERSPLRQNVDEAIRASGLAVQRLELELTESTLMKDSESALAILEGLRQMGVRIALDDFGTGYSSMAYLRSFPLDQVKIDKSFVSPLGLGHDAVSALAIVRAIHSLALALGLDVVAEGVESEAQEQVLGELGPHIIVQGYRYAKPMSGAHAMQFVWSHHDKDLVGQSQTALLQALH